MTERAKHSKEAARLAVAGLMALVLAGCQHGESPLLDADSAQIPQQEIRANESEIAAYLAGSFALSQNDPDKAADEFSHALRLNPTSVSLMRLAFTSSYYKGAIHQAAQVASELEKHGQDIAFGSEPALILAAEQGDWVGVNVLADHLLENINSQPLGVVMGAWGRALQDRGDAGLSRLLELNNPDLAVPPYVLFSQSALMNEYLGRHDDALIAANLSINHSEASLATIINMAGLMARQGQIDTAIAVLDHHLGELFDRKMMQASLKDGTSPLLKPHDLNNTLAEAILEASSIGKNHRINMVARLHLAHHLAPSNARINYLLGLNFRDIGDETGAMQYHQQIPSNSPWKLPSQFLQAQHLSWQDENSSEAKVLFDELTAQYKDNASIWRHAGDAARRRNDYQDALTAYDQAIALNPDNARLHYYRGVTLDELNRHDDAERALRQAIKLNPHNAYALNYFGYWLLEEGGDANEALDFIRTAITQQPQNGYFIDSLGWGYYKLGQYDKAVIHLEQAVRIEPADPVITDHLGDAYFKDGRHREAIFQWQRALTLNPQAEDITLIEAKIQNRAIP